MISERAKDAVVRWVPVVFFAPFVPLYAWICIAYLRFPGSFIKLESSIVVIAEQWLFGRPLYHDPHGPFFYTGLYGPLPYLLTAISLRCVHDPVLAGKIVTIGSRFLSWGILAWVYRRSVSRGGGRLAIAAVGLVAAETCSLFILPIWHVTDPVLACAVGVGLASLVVRPAVGAILLAVAIAAAVDTKLHGFLYLLPPAVVWGRRQGLKAAALVAASAAALALLVYALPGVSLSMHLQWLRLTVHHKFHLAQVLQNLASVVLLTAPVAFLAPAGFFSNESDTGGRMSEHGAFVLALFVGLAFALVPASKEGGSAHHLAPFIPSIAFLFAQLYAARESKAPERKTARWTVLWLAPWAAYMLVFGFDTAKAARLFESAHAAEFTRMRSELAVFTSKYPAGAMQMGDADDAGVFAAFLNSVFYRTGTPCQIDSSSWTDMEASGVSIQPLENVIGTERWQYWLMPHGVPPFVMRSGYESRGMLFGEELPALFLRHYWKKEEGHYYDVYEARSRGTVGAPQ